jgi:hypothetical protein
MLLEKAMPVLWGDTSELQPAHIILKKSHNGGGQVQGVALQFIDDVDGKFATLARSDSGLITQSSHEHYLLSPDYWGRKNTIGEGGSTACDELGLTITLAKQLQEAHMREYPSGASSLLTIARS